MWRVDPAAANVIPDAPQARAGNQALQRVDAGRFL
jgi:hypothetical protein